MPSTCPAIRPSTARPARELQADSDLGDRLVTTAVGAARARRDRRARALDAGRPRREALRDRGLIAAAALFLQGEARTIGGPLAALPHPQTETCHA